MASEDRTALDGDLLDRIREMADHASDSGASSEGERKNGDGAPDLSKLLEALMAQKADAEQPEPEPAARQTATAGSGPNLSALMAALPQLMDAMSGNADLVKPEKVNLVRAIQPYLPGEQAGSIDRIIRIANMTKAAKNALRLLGR